MFELIAVVILIVLNGLFALSELAVVSSRKPRLRVLMEQRVSGARSALDLAENPGRFLSTVQIGITLVGVLAGAFSGAALGGRLSAWLLAKGMARDWAEPVGFGLVIGIITFLSVIIGELVPKHLALKNPERIACAVAPGMRILSRAAAPVVFLLDASTRALLLLLGISPESQSTVTDEEIRTVVAEAESAGVIETAEQTMISGVMRLGDRTVRAVMTPRTEVEMLDLRLKPIALREQLAKLVHAVIPVHEGNPDEIVGVILTRDLVNPLATRTKFDIRAFVKSAAIVPDTLDALAALEVLRDSETPIALVHDEFGHFEGLITPADILDAIAGAFRSDEEGEVAEAVQREDGSWLIAGWLPADELGDLLYMRLPEKRGYDTAAGLVLEAFGRFPATGEHVDIDNWRFEVVDLDGRRIDKLLVSRLG
jgi:putative hemolysin